MKVKLDIAFVDFIEFLTNECVSDDNETITHIGTTSERSCLVVDVPWRFEDVLHRQWRRSTNAMFEKHCVCSKITAIVRIWHAKSGLLSYIHAIKQAFLKLWLLFECGFCATWVRESAYFYWSAASNQGLHTRPHGIIPSEVCLAKDHEDEVIKIWQHPSNARVCMCVRQHTREHCCKAILSLQALTVVVFLKLGTKQMGMGVKRHWETDYSHLSIVRTAYCHFTEA